MQIQHNNSSSSHLCFPLPLGGKRENQMRNFLKLCVTFSFVRQCKSMFLITSCL